MIWYCDVDGVVLNLADAICAAHGLGPYTGMDWHLAEHHGVPFNEFWAPLNTPEFWATCGKEPLADELVAAMDRRAFRFCTASFPSPVCYAGKVGWLNCYFPYRKIQFITDKWELARSDRVLVDDKEETVRKWVSCGGVGILWPRTYNSARNTSQEEVISAITRRSLDSVAYRV